MENNIGKIKVEEAIDNLEVIKKIIAKSRKNFLEKGTLWLYSGIMAIIGTVLSIIILFTKAPLFLIGIVWLGVGAFLNIKGYLEGKKKHKMKSSFLDNIVGLTWAATGISIMIAMPILAINDISYYIPLFVGIFIGIANVTSGTAYEYKWLVANGFILIIGSGVVFFILRMGSFNHYIDFITWGLFLGILGGIYPGVKMRSYYKESLSLETK